MAAEETDTPRDAIRSCEDLLAMLGAAQRHIEVVAASCLEFPDAMAMHRDATRQARTHLRDSGISLLALPLEGLDDDTDELLHRSVGSGGLEPDAAMRRRRRRVASNARVLVADGEEGPLLTFGDVPPVPLDDGAEDEVSPLATDEEPLVGFEDEDLEELEELDAEPIEELKDLEEIQEIQPEAVEEVGAVAAAPAIVAPTPAHDGPEDDIPEDELDLFAEDEAPLSRAGHLADTSGATLKDDLGTLEAYDGPTLDDAAFADDNALVSFDDEPSDGEPAFVSYDDDSIPSYADPEELAPAVGADDDVPLVSFEEPEAPVEDEPLELSEDFTEEAAPGDDETTLVLQPDAVEKMKAEAMAAKLAGPGAAPPPRIAFAAPEEEDEKDDDTEESAPPATPDRPAVVAARPHPRDVKPITRKPRPGERTDAAAHLYAAAASSPRILDSSGPKPKAAALQLNAKPGGATAATMLGGEEEDEPLEIGSVEDYGGEYDEDEDDDGGDGFRVELEEYEDDEEEDDDAEEAEPEPEPEAQAPAAPTGPDTELVQGLLAKARAAAERGDLDAGVNLYSDMLDADPDSTDAYIGRGRLYLDLGDYARAMSDFTIAEDLAPNSPEPYVATGDLYFARKEYRKAIECFDQALQMHADHAMAHCRRGISHYYRKNYKQALDDLNRAQKLDPDIPNIRTYVSMARKKTK